MERRLKIGAMVRTQLVPPYATSQIGKDVEFPKVPQVGIKSAAGHTEYKDAPQDSPEWQEYFRRHSEAKAKIESLKMDFTFDYGIEAWSWDDGATWETKPPDSWQFPETFKRWGLQPGGSNRADYIRYKLLILNEDMSIVFADTVGQAAPITNEEVDAALGGFRGDAQGSEANRNTA